MLFKIRANNKNQRKHIITVNNSGRMIKSVPNLTPYEDITISEQEKWINDHIYELLSIKRNERIINKLYDNKNMIFLQLEE